MSGIKQFFANKNIFITGATGFLGKVLIEKLLRSCPDIGTIYILVRPKRDKVLDERVQVLFSDGLFDTLKETYPERLKKVKPISGDISAINLGISKEDEKILIDNIHIIYHIAATIKFDDPLKTAIFSNVRSTKLLIELAYRIKNLVLFVHTSTAYCNVDKPVVEEELYPIHGNWREAIELAEHKDNRVLEHMTFKYIHPLPNTYLYTKSLAEHVVVDLCKGKIPAVIIRPSIVINMNADPSPGWTDNLNGPLAMGIGALKGVIRIALLNESVPLNLIPVDYTIKYMIQATYKHGFLDMNKDHVEVYNVSGWLNRTLERMIQCGMDDAIKSPCENILRYPRIRTTSNWYLYYITVILSHMLPAMFMDIVLRLYGKKPRVVKLQRKIFTANCVLAHFTNNKWIFKNSKTLNLESYVPPSERDTFCIPPKYKEMDNKPDAADEWQIRSVNGTSKFVFKEGKGKQFIPQLKRYWIIDVTLDIVLGCALCWFFLVKLDLITKCYDYLIK